MNYNGNGNFRFQDFYDCAQEVTDVFNHKKGYKMYVHKYTAELFWTNFTVYKVIKSVI